MHKVQQLLQRLTKFHWSVRPPESYTMSLAGKTAGLGLVASKDYAAFNVAYLSLTDENSLVCHTDAIKVWALMSRQTAQIINGQSLGDWLTQKNHKEFYEWYSANRGAVSEAARSHIERPLPVLNVRGI